MINKTKIRILQSEMLALAPSKHIIIHIFINREVLNLLNLFCLAMSLLNIILIEC